MWRVDRSTIQAVLAVLLVTGTFVVIVFGQTGKVPLEALFSLMGGVVGYYFGASVNKPSDGDQA